MEPKPSEFLPLLYLPGRAIRDDGAAKTEDDGATKMTRSDGGESPAKTMEKEDLRSTEEKEEDGCSVITRSALGFVRRSLSSPHQHPPVRNETEKSDECS
ncbi:unnamed protein product [Cuscuta campestris]|uniref:Uncharacterized protein n=1 Tax=Cuscuta campestris TaxID=132261 RepID=A0A484N856_9ASTE|nr:unnamed protein product [Cuscuta campestris]